VPCCPQAFPEVCTATSDGGNLACHRRLDIQASSTATTHALGSLVTLDACDCRAAAKAAPASRTRTVAKVAPVEVAQVAGEAGFIGGVALTMCAITLLVSLHQESKSTHNYVALQGLAVGFVLLRIESLAEEGKI
jgi:hypothetical protein